MPRTPLLLKLVAMAAFLPLLLSGPAAQAVPAASSPVLSTAASSVLPAAQQVTLSDCKKDRRSCMKKARAERKECRGFGNFLGFFFGAEVRDWIFAQCQEQFKAAKRECKKKFRECKDGRCQPGRSDYTLTVLHNNDGESQLLNAPDQPDFGGIARFKTLVDQLREAGDQGDKAGAVVLNSGDNFLAGPEWNASLDKGVPFYDSIALDAIGYDALAIGNHEFDFGPQVLADFISGFANGDDVWVSANLDLSGEPALQALADDGTIVSRHVITKDGEKIGVVGATTPLLPTISSPGGVEALEDVAGIVQEQVDALTAEGVNKVIMISHLQSILEDQALAGELYDVDVMIAGGGDELLANDGDPLVPGDEAAVDENGELLGYPVSAVDAAGIDIPIVTTAGDYKYLGKLVLDFDCEGNLLAVGDDSAPVRVSGVGDDAVEADATLLEEVVAPVAEYTSSLAETVVAQSEVALEGRRDPGIRTEETNLGNLMADALLWTGQQQAAAFGVDAPQVALQNGGGIRNNNLIPAGPLTRLTTFDIAPFSNYVSITENVPAAQFKEIMENAVSSIPGASGRFAQVAGFSFEYTASGTAQVIADGVVTTPGTRILNINLDDGTPIVVNGVPVDGTTVDVATNDFTAAGGDQYPFGGAPFTRVGVTYQQALENYLTGPLEGLVSSGDYPEGGSGRITQVELITS